MHRKKRTRLTHEEKFIISGSSHIGFGGQTKLLHKVFSSLPALKSRNCRRYFAGQLISIIGSWMQIAALGWLTLQLTNSAFMVGLVAALFPLPALFFSLFGGIIVDRFSKKQLLLITNSLSMLLAFALGILTVLGVVNITEVIVISLLGGIVSSVSMPAHFAYLSELVDKENISSAMSINAGISSLGRVLGPGIAGLYIAFAGTGGAFILNGLSYVAVIVALLLIDTPYKVTNQHLAPLTAIKEGIAYSFMNPMIRSIFLYVSAMSIFGWSYTTIIPVLARDVFHSNSTGMGYLFSSIGIGAIVATLLVSALSGKFSKLSIVIFGNSLFSLSLFLFSFTSNLNLGIFYLFLAGGGLVAINVILGTMVQLMADEKYRGRVSSIYYLLYAGLLFLGKLEIGYLTDVFGSGTALRINTLAVLTISLAIYFTKDNLRSAQQIYLKS